jgi:hypothetical protein
MKQSTYRCQVSDNTHVRLCQVSVTRIFTPDTNGRFTGLLLTSPQAKIPGTLVY